MGYRQTWRRGVQRRRTVDAWQMVRGSRPVALLEIVNGFLFQTCYSGYVADRGRPDGWALVRDANPPQHFFNTRKGRNHARADRFLAQRHQFGA